MATVTTISNLGYSVEGEIRKYYRRDTTDPPICATLKRSNLHPIDMSDVSSITFSMRAYGDVYATAIVDRRNCTVMNATQAQVCYYWSPTDLDAVGVYSAQFNVTYNSTVGISTAGGYTWRHKQEVFPTNIELLVVVVESI